ncbi:hypothetical protein HDF16_006269 [Granulicella aggregans]|uniref:Uncharacterized protein n=1 Tax=Granulicella aggregans TaxID=474949 RepID=A0A7W8E6T6_9BACT|nr:hypothetical protein [Granulicella aggregans]MBB5061533.1 hypothetical protein [Granulicella aggregans]
MKFSSRLMACSFVIMMLLTFASSALVAQCGGPLKYSSFSSQANSAPRFTLAGWPENGDSRWGDERDEHGFEPIVGLWHVDMEDTSKGYADKGYAAWHSDNTEFFNSTKAPGTGAVCQGVWEKIGRSTYQLNHFALGYNGTVAPNDQGITVPTETEPAQIVHIREIVTVSPNHKRFKGTFSVEVYSYVGHNLLVSFHGPITAERVTIDSPLSSQ